MAKIFSNPPNPAPASPQLKYQLDQRLVFYGLFETNTVHETIKNTWLVRGDAWGMWNEVEEAKSLKEEDLLNVLTLKDNLLCKKKPGQLNLFY